MIRCHDRPSLIMERSHRARLEKDKRVYVIWGVETISCVIFLLSWSWVYNSAAILRGTSVCPLFPSQNSSTKWKSAQRSQAKPSKITYQDWQTILFFNPGPVLNGEHKTVALKAGETASCDLIKLDLNTMWKRPECHLLRLYCEMLCYWSCVLIFCARNVMLSFVPVFVCCWLRR